jgi:hypothetical protein
VTGADFTGADFTGVDIDLLADYVGGALDGAPDHARVAALIVAEPAWRDAHSLLSGGMAEVATGLHEWGAEAEPMPADVAARLESALADPVDDQPAGEPAAATPRLVSVRESGLDRRRKSRRRQTRWGASLAAAAAAVAVAGVGIAYLGGNSSSSSDTATSSAAGVAAAPRKAALPSAGSITSTNRDYTAESLQSDGVTEITPFSAGNGAVPQAPSSPADRGESSSKSMAAGEGLTGGLTRLRPPAALQACLDAIGAANGAGTISVQSVDYARFAGSPALIVHFTAANGAWAWASGPSCGLPGFGPATAYSVQVG